MKLDPRFLTHVSKGEHYIISTGDTRFKGMVKNNETAAFIVECLRNDTDESALVDRLMDEYDIARREDAEKGVKKVLDNLRKIGALVE